MKAITSVRDPEQVLIAMLESLLDQARSGDLRGLAFVAYRNGTDADHCPGNVGDYSLAEMALGIKLLELEMDSIIVARRATPD